MTHPMNTLTRSIRTALSAGVVGLGALGLAACGGGGGSDSGSGSFSLGVTDAPVDDAESVFVEFASVTLVPADGDGDDEDGSAGEDSGSDDENGSDDNAEQDDEDGGLVTIQLDGSERIDLLEQQNGKRALLIENEQIPAGDYEQIRLNVSETTIVLRNGGAEMDLFCPSCNQSGLKLNAEGGLTIADGGALDLTIDFDLRKSVVKAGNSGKYILKPTLRLVQTGETGEIAASATGTYLGNNCADTDAQAIYVFEGADVVPDDIDGKDPEPVVTASLTNDDNDDSWTGTAAYLDPATYTVAFTCEPENDAPPEDDSTPNDDDIEFLDVRNVTVEAGETRNYDLP